MQIASDFLAAGRMLTLLDEHSGPGGIAHAYGVSSRKDLKHVLHGDYPLDEAMLSPLPGLTLVPAPRAAGMEFTLADEASLAGNLALLRSRSDCVMIDCVHRTERALSPIAARADQLLVMVPASDDELTRAYRLIKRAVLEGTTLPISIVVTQATDAGRARSTCDKLRRVALDHLGVHLYYQGAVLTPCAQRFSLLQPSAAVLRGMAGIDGSGRMGMADSMV